MNNTVTQISTKINKAKEALGKLPSKMKNQYNVVQVFFVDVANFSIFCRTFF
jgi:hypothetical protein